MTALFTVDGLCKRYGGAAVVDELSFAIEPGECLGLIGPNGAGKTTTLRISLGLTHADSGRVEALACPCPNTPKPSRRRWAW